MLLADTLHQDLDDLAEQDPDIKRALDASGYPPVRHEPDGFRALLHTIVAQQISKAAAASILNRVTALVPEVTARTIGELDRDMLRKAGLSGRKCDYVYGLCAAIESGDLDFQKLAQSSDQEVMKAITALRGFGPWSGKVFLLFCLGRRDVFPGDDLALMESLGRLKQLPNRPTAKEAEALTEAWKPRRSAAALLLWHIYRSGLP